MNTEERQSLPGGFGTVSRATGMHPDTEMNAVGLAIGATVLVLLLPALPFIAAAWLLGGLLSALGGRSETH